MGNCLYIGQNLRRHAIGTRLFTKLAAEPSPLGDLWLCVPTSRKVCPYSADYKRFVGLVQGQLEGGIEQTANQT